MIKVIEQMVEALEWCHGGEPVGTADAIKAGKQAIKELESQEPAVWITPDGEGFRIRFSPPTNDVPLGWDALYTHPPQRTEQELVCVCGAVWEDQELMETPPQRTWVGLTDEEVEKLDCVQVIWQDEGEVEVCGVKEFYRNIEAKLKQKNGFTEEKNT